MISELPFMYLKDKRVFVRADLNVPLENGAITDDFKLKALQPTLDLLIAEGARIIIGTHIDRPKGYDEAVSTHHLLPWFKEHAYHATYAPTIPDAALKIQHLQQGHLLILENLRFFPQEKQHDPLFAKQLAELADIYVNDAFGLLHRKDTSITLLAELFPRDKKTVGHLVEKELAVLNHLRTSAQRPFIVFLAGSKVKDKLPLIESLLDYVDAIAPCPALSFTFLKAQGYSTGISLVEDTMIPQAQEIIDKAYRKGIPLLIPSDYLISLDTLSGPIHVVAKEHIPKNGLGLTVGPQTLEQYKKEIANAGTLFVNGTMGFVRRPESVINMHILLQTIAQSLAYSVIGGGESVAAVYRYGLDQDISFCSSGGGSTLAYLGHNQLPGLSAIEP